MAKSSEGKHKAYSRIDQNHKKVAETLISMIEKGTAPWQKPWDGTCIYPKNGKTGKRYRGINFLRLYMVQQEKGYEDPRWMTFNQIKEAGGKVKAGEHGETVEYWLWEKKLKDREGKDMLDVNGEPIMTKLNHPVPMTYTVFNFEQTEGLPPLEARKKHEWEMSERAERIIAACGVPVFHDQLDSNYYSPSKDEIHLCHRDRFFSDDAYYGTALHEVGHSTGHPLRLNRDFGGGFGSPDYAKEELRAEIASFMLCADLGINHSVGADENHASYVRSWVRALEDDYNEIYRASADADKICDYIYEREQEYLKTHAREQAVESKEKAEVTTLQVSQAVMSEDYLERAELIKSFKVPERSKLTLSEQYMKLAHEQMKNNGFSMNVDDNLIAQQLLSNGNTRVKVVQTLLVHSPNCVNSYQAAGQIVNNAMKVPSVANSLKANRSR